MFTAISTFLAPYMTYIKVALVIGMLGAFGFAVDRVQAGLDNSKIEALLAADDKAALDAQTKIVTLTKKTDDLAQAAVVADNQVQTKIVTRTVTLTQKVPVYVTNSVTPCISYGFVRVLDAAVLETDPDTLPLPAGVTDDTCSPLTADDVAQSIVANYGTAEQNASQLNDLEGSVKAADDAQDAAVKAQ